MLVSDLKATLEGKDERCVETTLGDVQISGDAARVTIENEEIGFEFDEQVERAFSTYLGINKSYLAKCPPSLKAHNINWWLRNKPEAAAVVEVIDNKIINIHKPGLAVVPLHSVADIITRTFKPDNEIINMTRDDRWLHLDIMTDHKVEVRTDERIDGRKEVGDITHGGVRFLINPIETKPPKVLTYLHRLWCTNGSTSPIKTGEVTLKGFTVEQVLEELEAAANKVMNELDNKLAAYAALAERQPPGSPIRFAQQLGREYNLTQKVMDRIAQEVQQLPEDASLYDIQQVFTQLANGNVNYKTMTALQQLGGDVAFFTDEVVRRCKTCEQLLGRPT